MFDANEAANMEAKNYDSDLDSISSKNAELNKYLEEVNAEKQLVWKLTFSST